MWGSIYAAYAYAPAGLENPVEIGEKKVSEERDTGSLPLILLDSTMSSAAQYGMGYGKRYTPVETNIMAENAPYTRDIVLNFDYQKVMCYPWVFVMNTDFDSQWVALKTYVDDDSSIRTRYPFITAISYNMYVGEAGSRIETSGIVPLTPFTFTGTSESYENNRFEFSMDGFSALKTSYITDSTHAGVLFGSDNQGSEFTINYNTPNATVATDDTGYRYRYCVNEPNNSDYNVSLYFHDDSGMWEYIRSSSYWWNISSVIDTRKYSADEIRDYCLKQIAYIGFPFIYDYADRQKAIGETGVYLPVFDENGVTTGEYKEGADALDLPNAEWVDGRDSGYDPNKPIPGGDDEDEGIKVRPSSPGFTLAGRGTMCYELLESDIDEIFDDIYGRDNKSWNKLIKGLQMFGSDPMGAIISFKWYPFTFTPGESKAVYLGNTAVNPLHQYPTTDGISKAYVSTTATFRWDKPKNFVNSRYTKCRIYLPFYGFYELPISMMISKTLSVYMAYNVPDETAVWILSFDDVIYDFCECDPSIEIPLTGSNAGQIALVKRQAALSIAAQVATIAGTAIVGAQAGSGLAYLGYTASDSLVFSGALSPVIAEDVTKTLNAMAGRSVAGAGVSGLGSLGNIYNTVQNTKLQIGTLQTNLPHHGAASATTFLNLPMYPYIQFIQNIKMQGYNEEQYKLKVGHACDIWTTMNAMPENSLLQTTGMADMSSMSMELPEITELNGILQTGFYK